MDRSVVSTPLAATRRAERAAAFDRLASEHLDQSYRLARVIMGRSGDAEDAVHDAFETAWRKWSTLRDPAKFEPWFNRIVVNTCRDRLRRASRRRVEELDAQRPAGDQFSAAEDRDELDRALARLKADDQVVLALRYYLDLKVEDIAEVIDVRPGTVMSRIHRAQTRLRSILSAHEGSRR